jgi:hypothetical protein
MVSERADRTQIDAAAVLRSYFAAGDRTGSGAEIDTLTVGSSSLTDPGPTVRLVIRDLETNRPALPRD